LHEAFYTFHNPTERAIFRAATDPEFREQGFVMPDKVVRYRFERSGTEPVELESHLDPETLLERLPSPFDPPDWTALGFERCPNCPLDAATTPSCPAALRVTDLVAAFKDVTSLERAHVTVEVNGRQIVKDASLVQAIASLLGLRLATSGCPVLGKLRPMAAFHLPFATEEETLHRALATYLVAQLLHAAKGATPNWSLEGLKQAYREVGIVNRAFASRMRAALTEDANANALVRLDLFTKTVPLELEEWLESYGKAFGAWG
jgi:hypothetical protein